MLTKEEVAKRIANPKNTTERWWLIHRDELNKRRRDAYATGDVYVRSSIYQRDYRLKNLKKVRERDKKYRQKHRERYTIYKRSYSKGPKGRFRSYRQSAQIRGISFNLTFGQFMAMWGKECWYCGDIVSGIGIDRKDGGKGYQKGNVISACKFCNYGRFTQSQSDFIAMCHRVARLHPINFQESPTAAS